MQSVAEFRAYHRRITLVRTMFIHTADENYLGARTAFFERRDYDFWWLILHAVEKYLKAAILMNGGTAIASNHNLNTLLRRLKDIDPRLVPPPFTRPRIAGRPSLFEEDGDFVQRLNTQGSPANRYASYSYTISDVDLFRADHLIYWARRHARVLQQVRIGEPAIDWVDELANSPNHWQHSDGSPLERLASSPLNSNAAKAFVRVNVPFFPLRRHQPLPRRGSFIRNGPFYNMVQALRRSAPGSEERAEMRLLIEWVLASIFLPRDDRDFLQATLDAHP